MLNRNGPLKAIQQFLRLESAGGIILLFMLALILIVANSPLHDAYQRILAQPLRIGIAPFVLEKSLLLWINDGLMALFFLLLALEVKREILAGELSHPAQIVLPCVAAIGGVVAPALCYVLLNYHDSLAMRGWAIPTATDVALALGLLVLLGKRVPPALKVFLVVLAIFDDIVAILLIAVFYTDNLSLLSLAIAAAGILVLILMNLAGITRLLLYAFVGLIVWVAVLKSGVHATLAGVAIAFCIPYRSKKKSQYSPLRYLENKLHPWVTFLILPLFVLANAGVPFIQQAASITHHVPMGTAIGLFFGKQIGIFLFSWVIITLGFARLPHNTNWWQIYGASALAGIGFTMSLFISSLAFDDTPYLITSRTGILLGSFASAIVGLMVLYIAGQKKYTDG